MIRLMVQSQTYQLSSEPTDDNRKDLQNFARFYGRRLPAEVAHDAVEQATGYKTNFSNMSANSRAIDLPHERFGSYFLDTFDRPKRVSGCECERSTSATLSQVLLLSNSDEVEQKLQNGNARIAKMFEAKRSTPQMIEELYLASFGRKFHTTRNLQLGQLHRRRHRAPEGCRRLVVVAAEFPRISFNH